MRFTLHEFICHISGSEKLANDMRCVFGYDSEFTKMNCVDSLRSFSEEFTDSNFYVLKEGFSELCEKMSEHNKKNKNTQIMKNTKIVKIHESDGHYQLVSSDNNTFMCKNLVIAIKSAQLKQFKILKHIFKHIDNIHGAPLLRIYAQYPLQCGKSWFENIPKTRTNSCLRQIIPINPKTGLIMISYTDGDDIFHFVKTPVSHINSKQTKKSNISLKMNYIDFSHTLIFLNHTISSVIYGMLECIIGKQVVILLRNTKK